jgi:hypothetical protein
MNLTAFDRVSSDWFSIARKKAFTGWRSTFNVQRSPFNVWRLAGAMRQVKTGSVCTANIER